MTFHNCNCLNTCADILIEVRYRGEIIQPLKQQCNYNASNELLVTNHISRLSGAEWWFFKRGPEQSGN